MFTPQRLFGEAVLQPNTLSYEPFLERARVQREQDRDASARLALGGYVVARLVDKLLIDDQDSAERVFATLSGSFGQINGTTQKVYIER